MDDNSNSNKVRRCGQIGEGENDEVSMQDVLEEQARLQADASAVLGASDPNNCTYSKGYLNRQALYACATCTPKGNAGICLACSYACHEGHDLYELYTKRFFCCDCGNDKFSGRECKLIKDKQLNSRNHYNQNFQGLYCSCARPYPDPEDSVEDEMIQCIMCEDWHHGRHLKTDVPDDFSEMTCPECMSKFPFLWAYHISCKYDVLKKEESLNQSNPVDVGNESSQSVENNNQHSKISCPKGQPSPTVVSAKEEIEDVSSTSDKENSVNEDTCTTTDKQNDSCEGTSEAVTGSVKRSRDTSGEEEPIKSKVSRLSGLKPEDVKKESEIVKEEGCLLQSLQKREYDVLDHAAFWSEGWRSKLCKCQDCMEMYKDRDIEFLVEESDTMTVYEESGTNNEAQGEEEEENLFAGMHRVQQIEIARGVRDLKTELSDFLQGFAREGKVVTETDIREFFQSLEEKRRRRMNLPQNNCH